jgi:hypothetical protein
MIYFSGNYNFTLNLKISLIFKIAVLATFFPASQTASSTSYILSMPRLYEYKNPNASNFSSALAIEKKDLWQLISEPGTTPVIYYAPLSIQTDNDGFASVTTVINYTSDEGNAESLLGVSLYNCAQRTKQEQSTVQYSKHWADGDVLFKIGLEEPWNPVKVGTEGMRLLKVACDLR